MTMPEKLRLILDQGSYCDAREGAGTLYVRADLVPAVDLGMVHSLLRSYRAMIVSMWSKNPEGVATYDAIIKEIDFGITHLEAAGVKS